MTDTPRSVMIFAAGFGTRMRPLTDTRPKPMIPLAGRALIDRALDLAAEVSANRIVVNAHYKAEQIQTHLAGRDDVTVIHETPKILDTGGGLRNAQPALGPGPVWTFNPDALWLGPNPLALALSAWRPDDMDALLVCIPVGRCLATMSTGDFSMDTDGRLTRGPGMIYGGVQIIRTDHLEKIPEAAFSLNVLWDIYMGHARCFGVTYPGRWCDIGTADGLALAERALMDTAT